MSNRIGLKLDALDTLFFRDGKPFEASGRAEGGLPTPRTLAGALRTRLLMGQGIDLGEFSRIRRGGLEPEAALRELKCPEWIVRARFRGPWLARSNGDAVDPLVPVPSVLFDDDKSIHRAAPRESIPGWDDAGRWPLWHSGGPDAKPAAGFLTSEGLRIFLQGGTPSEELIVPAKKLFDFDDRTGIAIDPDGLTAAESMIYGVRLLVLAKGVCLYAEMVPGDGAPNDVAAWIAGPLALGGEGRHAVASVLKRPFAWPTVEAKGGRSLWLLTTPGLVSSARHPDAIKATVRSAATAAPMAVSGWDVARGGPERTRFAVPAGAVYFVEGEFAPLDGSFSTDEDAAQGWGVALRGRWDHA